MSQHLMPHLPQAIMQLRHRPLHPRHVRRPRIRMSGVSGVQRRKGRTSGSWLRLPQRDTLRPAPVQVRVLAHSRLQRGRLPVQPQRRPPAQPLPAQTHPGRVRKRSPTSCCGPRGPPPCGCPPCCTPPCCCSPWRCSPCCCSPCCPRPPRCCSSCCPCPPCSCPPCSPPPPRHPHPSRGNPPPSHSPPRCTSCPPCSCTSCPPCSCTSPPCSCSSPCSPCTCPCSCPCGCSSQSRCHTFHKLWKVDRVQSYSNVIIYLFIQLNIIPKPTSCNYIFTNLGEKTSSNHTKLQRASPEIIFVTSK